MYSPNDESDPREDFEFYVGQKVHLSKVGKKLGKPLTILAIGNSHTSYDYKVQSATGNIFFVKLNELAEGQV